MLRVYRQLEPNENIIVGGDPADGGNDYCAAQVLSTKHYDVPLVFQARMESQQFGHELLKLAKFISKQTTIEPTIAVERNVGMATIFVLQQNNYKNLFRMPRLGEMETDESDKIGWHTNSVTRPMMLAALSMALRQTGLRIYDLPTIKEMMAFIRDRSGKPTAGIGSNDDLVMSLAIALNVAQSVPKTSAEKINSISSKIGAFPQQQLFDENGISNV